MDVAIHADCGDALEALEARLADAPPRNTRFYGASFTEPEEGPESGAMLGQARAVRAIQDELPTDTVFTADIGEHLLFAIHFLRVNRPDQFITSVGLGSMGSGVGAAVGAQIAAPRRTIVSISGDFGFQMYGAELATCVQEHAPVVFVVMNDGRMRMVEAGLQRIYGRHLSMSGPPVNFAALATAHGARGFVARTEAELREALRSRATDGPTVIDVRIDPHAEFKANARVKDFTNYVAESS